MENKFSKGDKIIRKDYQNYSYSNIYNHPFIVRNITDKEYVLKQPNFIGNMLINCVNNLFEKFN